MSLPPNRELLKEIKGDARVFVESGSYRGDAIQQALGAGYDQIYSIDIDPVNTQFCVDRFNLNSRINPLRDKIKLFTGDTAVMLSEVLSRVTDPYVIWIDAHWQLFENEEPGQHPFPLNAELSQIWAASLQPEVILIDDILYLTHPDIYDVTGFKTPTRRQIESSIQKIDSRYKIEYIANPVISNLLIASL